MGSLDVNSATRRASRSYHVPFTCTDLASWRSGIPDGDAKVNKGQAIGSRCDAQLLHSLADATKAGRVASASSTGRWLVEAVVCRSDREDLGRHAVPDKPEAKSKICARQCIVRDKREGD